MTDFALGQKVTINDYLLRVRTDSETLKRVSEGWEDAPKKTLEKIRGFEDFHGHRKAGFRWGIGHLKTWIPESIYRANKYPQCRPSQNESWPYLRVDRRNNPTIEGLELPLSGIITRKVFLQTGIAENDFETGANWQSYDTQEAYEVTYDLHRRPLRVYPSMIAPISGLVVEFEGNKSFFGNIKYFEKLPEGA